MLNVIYKYDTLATMAHSQAHKADTHERILDAAAEQLRLRGLAGISIAELMKEVGLTHGGFYRHFASREDLVAQAVARALADGSARARVTQHKSLAHYVRAYLSRSHRDAPGQGCAIAALASEIAYAGDATRTVFTQGIEASLERIAAQGAKGAGTPSNSTATEDARDQAMLVLSTLVGSMVLARAVDDPALSDRLLAVGREKYR